MATTKKDKKQQMQVFVRVRPLNKQEGYNSVVDVVSARELTVKHHGGLKKYIYDRVFGPESKQIDVYKLVAEPAVKEVMAGYNCTVLAYGQTGTGKTYTMAGGNVVDMSSTNSTAWFEDVHSGIIPRTMAHMFDELRVHQLEYTVRVSYLELYNEEIFDLLSPIEDTQKLKLYDDSMKKGSVIVNNLTETTVNSKAEVFQLLEKGTEKRKIASTLMNAQSSRSHTVFCITVHTKENSVGGEDLLKTGKLYLVDLAGSENIKQSGATDIRAREAVSINQSLLTLGRCITKLIEHSGHIPYRESKLTRLLQDSLGGRTKTTLIATVSPAACNTDETLNTLTYAHQAKSITNKPEINQRLSKKTLLKEYTEEIERLRKDLAANRMGTGVYLAEDNYEKMMRERESHKEELTEKIGQLRAMQEQMADKEKLCETLKISLEEHQKEVEVKVQTISTMKNQLDQLSQEITDLTLDNECRQFLVEQFSDTEKQLKSTAVELLNVADTTTGETHKLHDKLDILAELTKHNKQSCEQHIVEFNSKIDGISNKLRVFHDKEYAFHTKMAGMLITLTQKSTMFDSKWQELIEVLHTLNGSVSQQKLDVDCNAQCTQVEFELGQCNIAQVIKTSQDTCLNKYDSSLVEQVHKMSNSIHEQGKFVTELINNWQEMINKNFSQVTEFVESCKTLVLETKEEVKTRIENDMRLCKQIQNEMMNQLKDKKSFESALDAQYSNVLRALNDMKTLKEEHAKNSNEQSMQRLRDLGGLHDNLMDLHDACTKKSDNTCDYIDQFAGTLQLTKQNNHDTIEMTDTKRNNMSDILDNSMETVNNLLHDHKENVIASYKEIEEACNKELRAKADLVAETFATQSSGLQKTENDLVELKDSLETVVEEFCTTVNNSRVAMQSSVEENDKCCGEMDSLVGTELDNCREGFRRLYSSSLKEYKVTGETPQRKTYRYPRTLPETQPLKLMQQWRQMRLQEIEKSEELEEPDELEEKENKVNNSEQVSSGNEINLSKIPRHHATIKESVIDENENP